MSIEALIDQEDLEGIRAAVQANPDVLGEEGSPRSVLMDAVDRGLEEIVVCLLGLGLGAKVNFRGGCGKTALMLACGKGRNGIAQLLLERALRSTSRTATAELRS